MDNEYLMESHLVEVIDKDWAKDSLPADDIAVSHIFFCVPVQLCYCPFFIHHFIFIFTTKDYYATHFNNPKFQVEYLALFID